MDLKTAIIVLGLCVPFVLMTFVAVMNAAGKDFGSIGRKGIWMMVSAIPFVGFIIYFLFGSRQGKKPDYNDPS